MKLFRITGTRVSRAQSISGIGETLYVGGIYPEQALAPYLARHGDKVLSRDLVGEGPTDFGKVETLPDLIEQCKRLRNWITGPVAEELAWGRRVTTAYATCGACRCRPYGGMGWRGTGRTAVG